MSGLGAAWAGATTLAAPALRAMLRRRVVRGKEIAERLPERQGIDGSPRPAERLIWVHGASVGESQSVLPMVEALLAAPDVTVLLTTGTVTSAAMLAPHLGPRLLHRFVPLDVPAWVGRFLGHWRPDAAAFVESELWPNLVAGCRARGVPMMLVNGRMSARSARGWGRAPGLARAMLGAFTAVHPQSEADGARLMTLGAREVLPAGNLKLATPALGADPVQVEALEVALGGRPVWLAASTHGGEEAIVAAAHARLAASHPGLVTIVAPRHPERGAALAQMLGACRRGAGEGPPPGGVWIADTLGELGLLYRVAPVVFVGRSLVAPGGGQNPLEPARLGCAVAVGPHTGNFEGPVAALRRAGGLEVVPDEAALAAWVGAMLADPPARLAMGDRAREAASGEAGLPGRLAEVLLGLAAR